MAWKEFYAKYRGEGLVSLRRKQLEVALEGNPTLLIWLGKQFLEQSDKAETKSTVISGPTFIEEDETEA